jgi:hypothetical protein
MPNKVRPAGLATADRGRASDRTRKRFLNTQSRKALQTTPWSSWLQIGQIATELVLPKVAAARERDSKTRTQLNLPFIDWDGQS